MNYEAWARWYDVFYSLADPAEVEFYVDLARESGGPVLEIGVGTGRIAIPIARAGIDVTGVDLYQPMLEAARHKLVGVGRLPGRAELMQADMRTLDLAGRRFPLVIIPANTLLLTTTAADQRRTLRRAAAHLSEGGTLVFSTYVPSPDLLLDKSEEAFEIGETVHPETGRTCLLYAVNRFNTRRQMNRGTQIAEELDSDGNVLQRFELEVFTRYIYPTEAQVMVEAAGLRVVATYGGFDRSPLDATSQDMVFVCERST